jgi:glucose-6-phosphate dehydrogenase assembly protein OpcA
MSSEVQSANKVLPGKVSPEQLTSILSQRATSIAEGGEQFVTAGTVNCILLVTSAYNANELDELTSTLSIVHPNRTFVVTFSDAISQISAEVVSLCHRVSHTEHICSDIIRLQTNKSDILSLLSLIRANLLTGMPTELVLLDPNLDLNIAHNFFALSESILYSSSSFDANFLKLFVNSKQSLIDFDWIKLGIWRDQIREIFDNPSLYSCINQLDTIKINYSVEKEVSNLPVTVLLLTGWLACMLSARLEVNNSSTCKFVFADNKKLNLVFNQGSSKTKSAITSIELGFNPAVNINILIRQENFELVSIIKANESEYYLRRKLEAQGIVELLKKYYFVGESTKNYLKSLRWAIEISHGRN